MMRYTTVYCFNSNAVDRETDRKKAIIVMMHTYILRRRRPHASLDDFERYTRLATCVFIFSHKTLHSYILILLRSLTFRWAHDVIVRVWTLQYIRWPEAWLSRVLCAASSLWANLIVELLRSDGTLCNGPFFCDRSVLVVNQYIPTRLSTAALPVPHHRVVL